MWWDFHVQQAPWNEAPMNSVQKYFFYGRQNSFPSEPYMSNRYRLVNYNGTQSFINTFSYSLAKNYGYFHQSFIGWFKLAVSKEWIIIYKNRNMIFTSIYRSLSYHLGFLHLHPSLFVLFSGTYSYSRYASKSIFLYYFCSFLTYFIFWWVLWLWVFSKINQILPLSFRTC